MMLVPTMTYALLDHPGSTSSTFESGDGLLWRVRHLARPVEGGP